ncbi:MAG: Type II secretion system (T2SS), protein M subtype b [Verrucomicrobiae bacterium]|nr:Type II secretion system (T2SS), protein M subtype b [Verrucomicrobiae bacterium]
MIEPLKIADVFSRLRSRDILIRIAVVLGLLVGANAVWGWYDRTLGELEDEILMKTLRYEKEARIIKNSRQFEQLSLELRQLKDKTEAERFVTGSTTSLAEASFQALVRDLSSKHRINIRAMRMLPKFTRNGFDYLQMEINTRAEIGDVRDFLLSLSQDPHFIFTDQVEIKIIGAREKRYYYFNANLVAMTSV